MEPSPWGEEARQWNRSIIPILRRCEGCALCYIHERMKVFTVLCPIKQRVNCASFAFHIEGDPLRS